MSLDVRRLEIMQPVLVRWPLGRVEGVVVAVADRSVWIEATRGVAHAVDGHAELEFEHRGLPVMLRGVALGAEGGSVCFTGIGTGAGHLAEPRREPRLPLMLPVEVTGEDGVPRTTTTVDVSAGGALLDLGGLGAPGARLLVKVCFAANVDLDLDAEVVRSFDGKTAVQFVDLDEAVGDRLRDAVLALRRALVAKAMSRPRVPTG